MVLNHFLLNLGKGEELSTLLCLHPYIVTKFRLLLLGTHSHHLCLVSPILFVLLNTYWEPPL